jgi:branched-chain amino acid transport system substrate-binding protein
MKRWLVSLLSMVLLLSAAGCGSKASPTGEQPKGGEAGEPYKIGAILDITGNASTLAVPERNTLQMLVKHVNGQGGIKGPDGKMHKVELVLYDNNGQESETVLLTNKLIKTDKVPVIICCTQSGTTLAAVDTVTKSQIPLVSLATSVKIVTPVEERKWVFKTPWNDATIVGAELEDMKSRNLTKIALLSVNNAYGDSARAEFEKQAPAMGIQIVLSDRFDVGVKDLTPLMNRVKASDAQAVVVWALPPETAIAAKAYKSLQMTQPLYVSHGVATAQFLQLAGDAAEGATMAAGKAIVPDQLPASDIQKQAVDQFNAMYRENYKDPISTFGGHAWDAFYLVTGALSKAGPDPAKIRDVLEKETKEFVGITGVFNPSPQDHTGLDKRSLVMIKVEGGKFKLVRTFDK